MLCLLKREKYLGTYLFTLKPSICLSVFPSMKKKILSVEIFILLFFLRVIFFLHDKGGNVSDLPAKLDGQNRWNKKCNKAHKYQEILLHNIDKTSAALRMGPWKYIRCKLTECALSKSV